MEEVSNTGNSMLTFYIEHISSIPRQNTNTVLQLDFNGEVNYINLKERVRRSLNITNDFELDYTPSRYHEHLTTFRHVMRNAPYVWLYTVPTHQKSGVAPWYLMSKRWTFPVLRTHSQAWSTDSTRHQNNQQRNNEQQNPLSQGTEKQKQEPNQYTNVQSEQNLAESQDLLPHICLGVVTPAVVLYQIILAGIVSRLKAPKLLAKVMTYLSSCFFLLATILLTIFDLVCIMPVAFPGPPTPPMAQSLLVVLIAVYVIQKYGGLGESYA